MQQYKTGDANDTFAYVYLRLCNHLKTSRSLPFVMPSLRHVYEIIREGYPCRLYFDLEFPKNENPNVDGDNLTCRWIELILWKLYEYFGLCLGFDSVVDLESSTDKKFSRHITFIIRENANILAEKVSFDGSHQKSESQNDEKRELLFLNNIEVGKFVFSVVSDMLQQSENDVEEVHDHTHHNKATEIDTCASCPEFKDFWLLKDGKPIFFADLGVYTRNRAFRLFSSSKYGKKAALTIARDVSNHGVNSLISRAIRSEKIMDISYDDYKNKDGINKRGAIMAAILKHTFVLPLDTAVNSNLDRCQDYCANNVFVEKECKDQSSQTKSDTNKHEGNHYKVDFDENKSSDCKYYAMDSQNGALFRCHLKRDPFFFIIPSIFHPKVMNQGQENKRVRASDFSIAKDWQHLKRPRSYVEDNSHISSSNIMPSPFPLLDAFVLAHRVSVSAGKAPNGYLTGWRLHTSSKSSMPGIYPGKFLFLATE